MTLHLADRTVITPGMRIATPSGRTGTVTAVNDLTFSVHWDDKRAPLTHPRAYAAMARPVQP